MKHIFRLGILALVGFWGWQMVIRLDTEAIAMMIGVLFGMLAGSLVSLLLIAADRQKNNKAPVQPRPSSQTIAGEYTVKN